MTTLPVLPNARAMGTRITGWCLLALLLASPASAGSILLASDAQTGILYRLDPKTASATPAGDLGVTHIAGLAYDPGTGVLYGIRSTPPRSLYTIDLADGAATVVGPTGVSTMHSLAFDVSTGRLFGSDGLFLYEVDPTTGAATSIGMPSYSGIGGLAFHPTTHVLYGCANYTGQGGGIFTIDTSTGAHTRIAVTQALTGLAFDPKTSELFAVHNGGGSDPGGLYTVDVVAGDVQLIADPDGPVNLLGLEFIAEGNISVDRSSWAATKSLYR
ncbi:MAG: hypothetical protein DHS20C21_10480 [Gemmatimonadota bacterium]|nr:MAG: hypothetical protein DHS20C21_10480 [Gemmatimonadota bacterium]